MSQTNGWIYKTGPFAEYWHWGVYRVAKRKNASVYAATCAADRKFTAFCSTLEQAQAVCHAYDGATMAGA